MASRFSAAYHAHVYFDSESRSRAVQLHEGLAVFGLPVRLSPLVDLPIGPHPLPMFEVDFEGAHFREVVEWLMFHHGELSVLIHPNTESEWNDHFVHALWLGRQLELIESALKP